MERLKKALKTELSGWRPLEVVWLVTATAIILGLSIYWKDTVTGILSALTGVWCVILTGKGKISNFWFGTVNVLLYAYIAFRAKYYGDVMLNLLYYFPANFVGIYCWRRHMDEDTGEVDKKRLNVRQSIIIYSATAAAVGLYGLLLRKLGGNLPFVDSTSTVLSVVAQVLCIKRYAEQWVLWIAVDVVTVIMWIFAFFNGGESVATLLMWIVYLLNAVFMLIKWERDVKK